MTETVKEFSVMDSKGNTSAANGYTQASQKALASLKGDDDVALIVIRVTRGKANEKA